MRINVNNLAPIKLQVVSLKPIHDSGPVAILVNNHTQNWILNNKLKLSVLIRANFHLNLYFISITFQQLSIILDGRHGRSLQSNNQDQTDYDRWLNILARQYKPQRNDEKRPNCGVKIRWSGLYLKKIQTWN